MMSLKLKRDPSTRISGNASIMSESQDATLSSMDQRIPTTFSFPGFYPVCRERLPSAIPSRYSSGVSEYLDSNMQSSKSDETDCVDSSQDKASSRISSWDSTKRVGSLNTWLDTVREDSLETVMKNLLDTSLLPPLKGASSQVRCASRDSITGTAVEQGMSTSDWYNVLLRDDKEPEPTSPVNQTNSEDEDVKEEEPETNEEEPTEEPHDGEMEHEIQPDDKGGYITDSYTNLDVLFGRGGMTNHRPGNIRYRKIITESKATYNGLVEKRDKTAFSHQIVAYIQGYGGRFLVKQETGGWHVCTKDQARSKTGQCLRTKKKLKWTSMKKVPK